MADKRISQLIERVDIANNDVLPIVASGATTTNKVTISTIQNWMQDNLDVGVTSVGITLGSSGNDVNVTGSPITTSGNITINIPTASATNRGLLSSADWSTFNAKQPAGNYVTLDTTQTITAHKTFTASGGQPSITINHSSGAGHALDITKAGNGEGIRVNKTSGSGNAMSVVGTLEATTLVRTGGTSSQFLKADGSVDSSTYLTSASASAAYVPYTGANSNVNLGQFHLDADTIRVNGSSPTSGSYLGFKHATNVTTGADGYTSMYTFGTNTIAFKSVSGATTKDFSFSMVNITAGVPGGRQYTLPDSSGTLALTSDLGAYLPLSGGTMTGAINGISANFTSNLSSDSGVYSNTAFFAKHNPGSTVTVNGWNAMQGDANTFIVLNSTKGMRINFPSNASFTHTLPDASGTIALTSNLSSYLPLSGGTLTGALNGTTASFTGAITSTGTGLNPSLRLTNTTASTGTDWHLYSLNNGNLGIYNNTAGAYSLQISSTGAATFSSSVTAGKITTSGAASLPSSSALSEAILLIQDSGSNRRLGIGSSTSGQWIQSSYPGVDGISSTLLLNPSGGNVGIGTASPSAKTHIVDNTPLVVGDGSGSLIVTHETGTTAIGQGGGIFLGIPASSGSFLSTYIKSARESADSSNSAGALVFGTRVNGGSNTERMRITSGGNVGIGTASPSNPPGFTRVLNISGEDAALVISNTSGTAKNYTIGALNNGSLGIFDGTTGRIRITSDGNVGIGTASALQTLTLAGTQMMYNTAGDGNVNTIIGSITSQVRNYGTGIATSSFASIQFATDPISWFKGDIRFLTNGSDGTSTGGTERMRITSGGFLKVSNTGSYNSSTGTFHEFNTNQNDTNVIIRNTSSTLSGARAGIEVSYSSASPNSTTAAFYQANDTGGLRFEVRSNGGIGNYQANDVNLSDERTKKDIEPLESYWDKFKEIEIVKFKYKDQTHDDFNIGVIAQQVEAVAPEFVDVDGWGSKPEVDEEGNEIVSEEEPLKSIYTADLYHASIKVLQEAMAKIEKLEAEIEALKSQING